jgi:hypothetical protein
VCPAAISHATLGVTVIDAGGEASQLPLELASALELWLEHPVPMMVAAAATRM